MVAGVVIWEREWWWLWCRVCVLMCVVGGMEEEKLAFPPILGLVGLLKMHLLRGHRLVVLQHQTQLPVNGLVAQQSHTLTHLLPAFDPRCVQGGNSSAALRAAHRRTATAAAAAGATTAGCAASCAAAGRAATGGDGTF